MVPIERQGLKADRAVVVAAPIEPDLEDSLVEPWLVRWDALLFAFAEGAAQRARFHGGSLSNVGRCLSRERLSREALGDEHIHR